MVLGLAALLLAIQISPWYYSHGDAPGYISIARSLARGTGLRNMDSPILWYPPGYSILISPLFCLRDLPLLEISIVQWFLAVGFLLGVYRWARSQAPEAAVWIAAISVGTSAVWIHYRRPVSELAFMTAMAWMMVSLDALARAQSRGRFLAWLAAATGLTIAACSIRSLGLALAAGGSCALLSRALRIRFSDSPAATKVVSWQPILGAAVLIGMAGAMTVGAVVLHDRWAAQAFGGGTYLDSIEAQRDKALFGGYSPWFALVVSEIGRVTVPFMFKSHGHVGCWLDVNMLIYIPLLGLLLFGYWRWIRRDNDPLAWSMPFYLAILTYFRWESGARYWVPMTPGLLMCLWFAMERWGLRRLDLLRAVWLLHILAALVYWFGVDLPRARQLDQKWPTARSLADQITVDRDRVLIDESMADLCSLLMLQLDRQVGECKPTDAIPASAQWLILPTGRAVPPGFSAQSSAPGCELLHRGG